jgi:hypothetical protein
MKRFWVPVLACLLLVACGGSDKSDGQTSVSTQPAVSFPKGGGKSLAQLVGDLPEGPVLAPTGRAFQPGKRNRLAFALFTAAREQVRRAQVAVYLLDRNMRDARGPYLARAESLDVKAQYRSRQTASDLGLNDTIYVAHIPIPRSGSYVVAGVASIGGDLVRTSQLGIKARKPASGDPPSVGDRAPLVHTPTAEDVGGDLQRIDTRIPPVKSLHEVDAADVIGREPLVLLFATPQLCQSRVCGPVTDIAYQVQSEMEGDDVRFVHMEIYNDNAVAKGLRPQVRRYHLPTEPWTFVIDRRGIIRDRFEGAFSASELSAAVARVR